MNIVKKTAKNMSLLFLSQVLSYVIGFFTLIFSARYLGVEGFGIISFAIAFTGIFGILADLGLKTLAVREISRNLDLANKYLYNFTLMKLLLGAFTIFLSIFALIILNYSPEIIFITTIILLSVIVTSITQNFYSVFQSYHKMSYQAIGTLLNSILILIGVLLVIYFEFNLILFSSVYFLASLLVFIFIFMIYGRSFFSASRDLSFCIDSLREAWPFAVTNISINIYLWIDSILLSILVSQEAVGYYNAAYRLILITTFIPVIFGTVFFPLMSKYYLESVKSLKITFNHFLKIMLFLGIPLGVGTYFIADNLVNMIYGSDFSNSAIILQILIWSSVLIFIRSPFERLLESMNKQMIVTKIFIIGVIFNIITNLYLIPKFSYIGSAFATILTDIFVLLFLILILFKYDYYYFDKKIIISTMKIIVAALFMGVILTFVETNIWLAILIGFISYLVISILLKTINDEINLILKFR